MQLKLAAHEGQIMQQLSTIKVTEQLCSMSMLSLLKGKAVIA